jgi:FAD/FMN-containing dehydrogenase
MSSKEALTSVDPDALHELRSRFSGLISQPGDESFVGFPNSPAGQPAFIAAARSTDDVAHAIAYARDERVPISVRSGGHTAGSWTTDAGGFVLDLSGLNTVEVLDGDLVRIGSGAVWGQVASALAPHGLALSSGDTTTVGVGGLTLGGGIGWMVRKYGLAIDSLVAADLITADGDRITASASENDDLFWALRGGGGNFGVVTHFTFHAHPLTTVFAGAIRYDAGDLTHLLRGWRDAMRAAPEELNTTFLAMPSFGPEMPASTQVLVCYAGNDEGAAMAALEPLLQLDGVQGHDISEKAYGDVLEEPQKPDGEMTIVGNNGFIPEFSDECIDALAAMQDQLGGSVLMIRSLAGAFNRVPQDATAFAARDSEVLLISASFLPPNAPADAVQRMNDLWAPMKSYAIGAYGNFSMTRDDATVAAIYPPATHARLAEIKRRYDPDNLFSQNQNIRPASR